MTRHLRLLDPSHCSRDGFPFKDPATPESKFTARGKTLTALFKAARDYRTANDIAIPDDFEWQIETAICKGLPPGECVHRDGSPPDLSCAHRGEEIRREKCDSCGGNVIAKILSCALHGECSLFKRAEQFVGVTLCATCPDRVSTLPLDER